MRDRFGKPQKNFKGDTKASYTISFHEIKQELKTRKPHVYLY